MEHETPFSEVEHAGIIITRLEKALKPVLELARHAHITAMRASEALGEQNGTGAAHACLALMEVSLRALSQGNDAARYARHAMGSSAAPHSAICGARGERTRMTVPDSPKEGSSVAASDAIGEDTRVLVQNVCAALVWASWLQSVSDKARAEIRTAVLKLETHFNVKADFAKALTPVEEQKAASPTPLDVALTVAGTIAPTGTHFFACGQEEAWPLSEIRGWIRKIEATEVVPIPGVLFCGWDVFSALSDTMKRRTSAENVSDVLDTVVKLLRAGMQTTP